MCPVISQPGGAIQLRITTAVAGEMKSWSLLAVAVSVSISSFLFVISFPNANDLIFTSLIPLIKCSHVFLVLERFATYSDLLSAWNFDGTAVQ